MSGDNVIDFDGGVVILKLLSGDIILGQNRGIEPDTQGLCVGNPLVLTSTAGYILLTDFVPFLTSAQGGDSEVVLNPGSVVYVELCGEKLADYYKLSCKYRDAISEDMEAILDKSSALIQKTLLQTLADKVAKHASGKDEEKRPTTIGDLLDTPIADALGAQADSADEQGSGPDTSKVVDFNKILADATKKKDEYN